jgi:transcription elongation GreA/GreB family factor
MQETKKYLYQYAQNYVADRITSLKDQIKDLKEDLNAESKSTAGDKHETGRAMMQIELENLGRSLRETELLQETLRKIQNPQQKNSRIALGSLVACEGNWYYLSISAGILPHMGKTFYLVSIQSPVGRQLVGKSKGDKVLLPNGEPEITDVY